MDEDLKCLRCGGMMKYIKSQKLQLGEAGWILGDLSNLLSGALKVDIYICNQCGKIEFFQTESESDSEDVPQKECPCCGKFHDFDCPKCPFCNYDYYAEE